MLRRIGQAARRAALLGAEVVAGIVLLASLAVLALAVRLAIGPINVSFLLPRVETALEAETGTRITIQAATLDWPGLRHGPEYPLLFTFDQVTLRGSRGQGSATIPEVTVALALTPLLHGRLAPRRITIERPDVVATRNANGRLALAFDRPSQSAGQSATPNETTANAAGEILAALTTPRGGGPTGDRFSVLRDLDVLTLEHARLTVIDRRLRTTWRASDINVVLERSARGVLSGGLSLVLQLGHAPIHLAGSLRIKSNQLSVAARLSRIDARDLAAALPSLTPLTMLEAPLDARVTLGFGHSFTVDRASVAVSVGAGDLLIGSGKVPIRDAVLSVVARGKHVALQQILVHLGGAKGAMGPTLSGRGDAVEDGQGIWHGALSLALDRVPMAELARYWPVGVAPGGRAWVTENITAGLAEDGRLVLAFDANPRGKFTLSHVSGQIAGHALVVHWLRPLPPLTNGTAELLIDGTNALRVHVAGGNEGPLTVEGGDVVLSGLDQPNQNGAISARIKGPLKEVLALLGSPRLNLLARQKLPLSDATGQVSAKLSVAVPLLKHVKMDAVFVHADAELHAVSLPRLFGRHGFDQATLALAVDNDGLKLSGRGLFAQIPTRVTASMDFRRGPPTEVAEKIDAQASLRASALSRFGLGAAHEFVHGPIALDVNLGWRRNGSSILQIGAGLRNATLTVPLLDFVKPPDVALSAEATLALSGDRITRVDRFTLRGPGVAFDGSANFAAGRLTQVQFAHVVLGRTEGQGTLSFGPAGAPIRIDVSGQTLDLSRHFGAKRKTTARVERPPKTAKPGAAWQMDARFGRIYLARDKVLQGASLRAASDGRHLTSANLAGDFASGKAFSFSVRPNAGGRALTIRTQDAGSLLAGVGVTGGIAGGTLRVTGEYDDRGNGSPLTGRAEVSSFRVRNVPLAVKVLEGMSLYGLVQAVQGPGLEVSELVAPFRLVNRVLELNDVRASNPALGATIKGTINLAEDSAALSGTIVPAYFLNSLPGRIPLIGRIFSPEKGGGLLAATYHISGSLDDPRIVVNPLASLTPGFLRGFFSLFGG